MLQTAQGLYGLPVGASKWGPLCMRRVNASTGKSKPHASMVATVSAAANIFMPHLSITSAHSGKAAQPPNHVNCGLLAALGLLDASLVNNMSESAPDMHQASALLTEAFTTQPADRLFAWGAHLQAAQAVHSAQHSWCALDEAQSSRKNATARPLSFRHEECQSRGTEGAKACGQHAQHLGVRS